MSPGRADLWGLSTPANGTPEFEEEHNYNKVFRFDEQGNKLPNDIPYYSAGLDFPAGIAVSPHTGHIYVSSVNTGSILHYNGQTGAPLESPSNGPEGTFAFLGTAAPGQLAFGPDGNLYVSEYFGQNVRVYDAHPGANFGNQLANAASGLSSAGGLAFAANGDLLVGDGFAMAEGQHAKIVRVHNGVQSTWGFTDTCSQAGCPFYAPAAMLTQANGDVLVVDLLANYIARVTDAGVPSFFASIPPPIAPPGTNFPSDITFDPNGNIVVSVLGETNPPDDRGALLRYDLNGNLLETIESDLQPIAGVDYTPDPDTLLGDYDGDDSPGESGDYNKWRADFGKFVAAGNGADGSRNGVIDAADYIIFRKNAAGSASGAGVPEPTSVAGVMFALYAMLGVRNRRSHTSSAPA
jgi:DNA-binding beta-propeller fold protein YncE